ncbi:MAG: hypothetical protein JSW39_02765 [Desulfobacterales bacterium]|nr:MAG: hypothetical protein JSW39_02765 [Desulfobacterales bacterium]
MNKPVSSNLAAQSLTYVLIGGAGIVVFIFMIILPYIRTAAELDADIIQLSARIEEQRILTPIFKNLLQQIKNSTPAGLPTAEMKKLTLGEMNSISELIRKMARRHDLTVAEITPDVDSITKDSGHLLINLIAVGKFFDLRKFIVDLGTIPSLEHIEALKISSIEDSREVKLKIWLAQE